MHVLFDTRWSHRLCQYHNSTLNHPAQDYLSGGLAQFTTQTYHHGVVDSPVDRIVSLIVEWGGAESWLT